MYNYKDITLTAAEPFPSISKSYMVGGRLGFEAIYVRTIYFLTFMSRI